jgi:PPOX class probable F420-dependent enzyme
VEVPTYAALVDIETLAASKYLSLTTYRKNGDPVATPVWLVRDGDELNVITQKNSGKVKRIRNNSAVLLAPCDARGKIKGDSVPGQAILLDEQRSASVAQRIKNRYGLLGKILMWRGEREARKDPGKGQIGIAIRLTAGTSS